eukprot:scaffold23369_cov58-Attheya_sp.AAC.1
MEDITVQDENQNDINLLTFHGEDEWATDTEQDEIDIVLKSQASIRKPFLLAPPSIADVITDASIEVTPGVQGPGRSDSRDYSGTGRPKTGERIALTVEQYHNAILNCANFFPQSGKWEVDVVQHFMTHLSSSIKIQ